MALSQVRVALIGSSYLRQLGDDIQNGVSEEFLADFGLEQIDSTFICGGGWLLEDILHYENEIKAFKPQIIFLQIGGNDLSRYGMKPETVADQLLQLASYLRSISGAHAVLVGHITRRVLGKYLSSYAEQSEFELARYKANQFLKMVAPDHAGVKFWKHRGMEDSQYDILSSDGVHFNDLGQSRFYRSVRGAILYALNHL